MTVDKLNPWEVWFAKFPYEEEDGRFSRRPVIVLHATANAVLVVKVTCHDFRRCDSYDVILHNWKNAHLNRPSVARVSKTMEISPENLVMKIGTLQNEDAYAVFEAYSKFVASLTNLDFFKSCDAYKHRKTHIQDTSEKDVM